MDNDRNESIVKIKSAVHSNYRDMVALFGADHLVYLGKKENYDSMGHYDNTDDSLLFVSANENMYKFLYSDGWTKSQSEMLARGLTMEEYEEFEHLQNTVLKPLEKRREILFDGVPFQPTAVIRKEIDGREIRKLSTKEILQEIDRESSKSCGQQKSDRIKKQVQKKRSILEELRKGGQPTAKNRKSTKENER